MFRHQLVHSGLRQRQSSAVLSITNKLLLHFDEDVWYIGEAPVHGALQVGIEVTVCGVQVLNNNVAMKSAQSADVKRCDDGWATGYQVSPKN